MGEGVLVGEGVHVAAEGGRRGCQQLGLRGLGEGLQWLGWIGYTLILAGLSHSAHVQADVQADGPQQAASMRHEPCRGGIAAGTGAGRGSREGV